MTNSTQTVALDYLADLPPNKPDTSLSHEPAKNLHHLSLLQIKRQKIRIGDWRISRYRTQRAKWKMPHLSPASRAPAGIDGVRVGTRAVMDVLLSSCVLRAPPCGTYRNTGENATTVTFPSI